MSKQRKALEMALEALQWNWGGEPLPTLEIEAIEAIKMALAEPEQESLTIEQIDACSEEANRTYKRFKNSIRGQIVMPEDCWEYHYARAIERAHGIGNV